MPADKAFDIFYIALATLIYLCIVTKRKPLKWVLLAFVILLLVLSFLGIPVQTKWVCEFDDGDQMVVRQKYKYQAVAGIFRQHPFTPVGSPRVYYKPKGRMEGWKKVGTIVRTGNRLKDCSNFRKVDGVITTGRYYKFPGGDWQDRRRSVSEKEMPELKERLSERDEKMKEKEVKIAIGLGFAQIDDSTLLNEVPLVPSMGCYMFETNRKDAPVCVVRAVFQSYSHDGGQTWSKMELTEDSKLYELGKPLFEQKGVARPVDWTGKK